MREDSRRGAPRSTRAPGRAVPGRDVRAPRPGGRGAGPGGAKSGYDGNRPAQGGRPAPQGAAGAAKLTAVLEPVLNAMEIDLEAVKVSSAGRRVVLRIVVDADGGVSLDDIAEVSREVSAKLDASSAMGDAPYTLEVTSPGIDRPLTQLRHWRRAAGRLVVFTPVAAKDNDAKRDVPTDPVEYAGRILGADEDRVTIEIDGASRTFGFDELGPGRVQVEFGRLDEFDDLDEVDEVDDATRASEEETDGH